MYIQYTYQRNICYEKCGYLILVIHFLVERMFSLLSRQTIRVVRYEKIRLWKIGFIFLFLVALNAVQTMNDKTSYLFYCVNCVRHALHSFNATKIPCTKGTLVFHFGQFN